MKSIKRNLGVSLIALIITIAVLVIIAGAVLFRGGLDRIPWAKGGVHDMDKSIVAESVELYAADKSTYPVIRVSDKKGNDGIMTAGVLTATVAFTLDTAVFTPDTTQVEFDGVWYNVSAVAAGNVTLLNPPADTTGKSYTIRYVNKLSYNSTGNFQAQVASTDAKKVTIKSGLLWPVHVGPGTQIKIDTTWYDVASRYSDTIIYISSDYSGAKDTDTDISIRRSGYVEPGSYVYDFSKIPAALKTKINTDLPNVETKGDGVFEVVDMKVLADSNYITKTSDKGFACYNSTGLFDPDLLDSTKNPDKYDQIYIRHSTTGMLYYMEGVKAENNTVKY